MSREDIKLMQILQQGANLKNSHYQVPLPFKDPYINLSNNRYYASQRFHIWRKKSAKMTNPRRTKSGL